jgi:hypothetical protein
MENLNMNLSRRAVVAAAFANIALPVWSQGSPDFKQVFDDLVFGTRPKFNAAMEIISASNDQALIAPLMTAYRFSRAPESRFDEQLARLTGEDRQGWFDWMLWQEANPQVIPLNMFPEFKRKMLMQIDENFSDFLRPEYLPREAMKIRLEEITWGGVVKDGIPSLDSPTMITPDEADYMRGSDLVFGVSINGDVRAYPLRIMGWHEMFNDVIGGVPLALAYCTLCGSGILFETQVKGRNDPFVFGSSGFLYRSNKLMFDRETNSLWNQYTGKPVVGPLTKSGIELKQRPVAIATWADWQRDNPTTKVLDIQTGHRRDYGSGQVYKQYFSSKDLMFPALVDEQDNAQKDYVFAIRQFGAAKAWPLDAFKRKRVINDNISDRALVLIGEPKGRTVRAYEREGYMFNKSGKNLKDQSGDVWTVTEDEIRNASGESLPRVAGHISYWFAWDNYIGDAGEVYQN